MLTVSELQAVLDLADRWVDGRTVGADCRERPTHRLITMVNGGHPADGRQGWDLMEIDRIASQAERDRLIRAARSKLWKVWSATADKVVFYKPTGVRAPWSDEAQDALDRLIEDAIGV